MSIKVAINGFGRIGRSALRRILDKHPDLEIVAINDLADNKTLAHLLKYDSVYGKYNKKVEVVDNLLVVNDKEIKVFAQKDPSQLSWKELGIDIVLECSGFFTDLVGARKHLEAGAKKVIISAPCKSEGVAHFILGVNEEKYSSVKDDVVSMGSCTTNCLAPVAKILYDNFIIETGLVTTIHSYTNDQHLLDAPHKDLRRARAANSSIIPTTTGAAIAVAKVIPELEGRLGGLAVRVPTLVGSLVDFVAKVEKKTTIQEVNDVFIRVMAEEKWQGILSAEEAPLVSADYIGNSFSATIDILSTKVEGENLIKVLAWYDNEWGYACRLAEFAEYVGIRI